MLMTKYHTFTFPTPFFRVLLFQGSQSRTGQRRWAHRTGIKCLHTHTHTRFTLGGQFMLPFWGPRWASISFFSSSSSSSSSGHHLIEFMSCHVSVCLPTFGSRSKSCNECPFDPFPEPTNFDFDVVVIGAGCVGACVSRELSK